MVFIKSGRQTSLFVVLCKKMTEKVNCEIYCDSLCTLVNISLHRVQLIG